MNIPAGQPQVARPLSGYMLSEVSRFKFPREQTMSRNSQVFDTMQLGANGMVFLNENSEER